MGLANPGKEDGMSILLVMNDIYVLLYEYYV